MGYASYSKESTGKLLEKDGRILIVSCIGIGEPLRAYGRLVIENEEIREILKEKDCSPTKRYKECKWWGLLPKERAFKRSISQE